MGYTFDPDVLMAKLEQLNLIKLTEDMRAGKLSAPTIVEAKNPKELDKARHLLYSFFKHANLTGAYQIKWHTPSSLKIVPNLSKLRVIREETATSLIKGKTVEEVIDTYKEDTSFLNASDDELMKDFRDGNKGEENDL